MNPSWGPDLFPVAVGRGGEEEVKVVARRVGLKRREEGFGRRRGEKHLKFDGNIPQGYLFLPDKPIVP